MYHRILLYQGGECHHSSIICINFHVKYSFKVLIFSSHFVSDELLQCEAFFKVDVDTHSLQGVCCAVYCRRWNCIYYQERDISRQFRGPFRSEVTWT